MDLGKRSSAGSTKFDLQPGLCGLVQLEEKGGAEEERLEDAPRELDPFEMQRLVTVMLLAFGWSASSSSPSFFPDPKLGSQTFLWRGSLFFLYYPAT